MPLAERTGPILWQLPPSFQKNEANWKRLARFLKKLPLPYRHAVEFRHPSWMDEETMALLREHRVANVWISSLKMPADHALTADFVFLRFHGLEGGAYHDYTDDELRPWAGQLVKAARKGIPAFVYFNNDLNTRAPLNAHAMMRLVGKFAVGPLAVDAAPQPPEIAPPVIGPETWRPWTRPAKKAPVRAATRRAKKKPAKRPRRPRQPTTTPGGRRFAAATQAVPVPATVLPKARM